MKRAVIWLIKIYQKVISPFKGPCCRFYPSCSNYTIQAIEKYGTWRGLKKGFKRVIRCHPFSKGGYDPVE